MANKHNLKLVESIKKNIKRNKKKLNNLNKRNKLFMNICLDIDDLLKDNFELLNNVERLIKKCEPKETFLSKIKGIFRNKKNKSIVQISNK